METYEIVNSNKKTLIPLLKSLKIDIFTIFFHLWGSVVIHIL